MFTALGRLVTRFPWIIIGVWIVFAVVVVSFAPKLQATTDQADFLPDKYESKQAITLLTDAFPAFAQTGPTIVFDRADGQPLSAADRREATATIESLQGKLGSAFNPTLPPLAVAPSGTVAKATLGLANGVNTFDDSTSDSVVSLRAALKQATAGSDLRYGVTGSIASNYDQTQASKNSLTIVGVATVLLILILLALIFRSVIISIMPIVVVAIVSVVATGLIGVANQAFNLKIDSSVQQILTVVLFGVGTDYILFFLFRYRERLREGEDIKGAVAHALERAGEAIASAGGAVIVTFLALLLSSLGIFKSIGPALAIAVAVTLVAALTLVPAVVTVLGTPLFWPSKNWMKEPEHARFSALGRSLGAHPLRFAVASGGVLVVLTLFAFQFNPTFDLGSSGSAGDSESAQASDRLDNGFPKGAIDPSQVLLHSTTGTALDQVAVDRTVSRIKALPGVADASGVFPGPDGKSVLLLSQDQQTALISLDLVQDPSSQAALSAMKDTIRDGVHAAAPPGTTALVGGTTSIFVDFQAAVSRDYSVIFPVAALVIMLILALLLRSVVAPLYLMLSVGLGFGATLGTTVLIFQHLKGDSGLIFILPIYMYLFVVALGTDYNILMVARLREEAREGLGPREAAAETVKHAAPTVASAGLILTGSFASLMLGGNSLLVTLGFSIAFGILVSAFVMAIFFVPAITALIGHAAWWPGHGDESAEEHDRRVADPTAS